MDKILLQGLSINNTKSKIHITNLYSKYSPLFYIESIRLKFMFKSNSGLRRTGYTLLAVNSCTYAQHINHSPVASFFSSNTIITPRAFKFKKTSYLSTHKLPILRFLNMLMRAGYREFILTTVWRIFLENFTTHPLSLTNNSLIHFLTVLKLYEPIFTYKIEKVAKRTRKNSRGKSGKYLILWKYTPPYKRVFVVLRWLLTDVRLVKSRTFASRCEQSLLNLRDKPHDSILLRLKKFNHSFIFKHFRKTLLTTLKTTRSNSI